MHIQVYAQNNFAHFSCKRHVCLIDTTRFSSNWQTYLATGSGTDLAQRPESHNSTPRYSHKTFLHSAALGNCEE